MLKRRNSVIDLAKINNTVCPGVELCLPAASVFKTKRCCKFLHTLSPIPASQHGRDLRGWTAAFAGSVKAITESLSCGLISDSSVNGIRCRVAQVSVENAPIPTAAKIFRQRMNAGCRVAVLSLLGRRIDPRQTNHALRRFKANSHRSCLSV